MDEKKEWVEILESKTIMIMQDDLRTGAERLTKKVKTANLTMFQKMKGMQIGQTALKVVYNKMGNDYMELQIITKGVQKCMKELKKGKIIETDNLKKNVLLKRVENKFFMQYV